MVKNHQKLVGFTIVELLIVIVIIGVLATITVVAYNGIQDRARTTKINADLTQLQKAIIGARVSAGTPLRYITSSAASAGPCLGTSDADLSDKTTNAGCWSRYSNTLAAISTQSNVDVRNLVDPWGWPYYIDENEDESPTACVKDSIGTFKRPIVQNQWLRENIVDVPFSIARCS